LQNVTFLKVERVNAIKLLFTLVISMESLDEADSSREVRFPRDSNIVTISDTLRAESPPLPEKIR